MMKFKVGDTVRVIKSGAGFAESSVGAIHVIEASDATSYFRNEGYQVIESGIKSINLNSL